MFDQKANTLLTLVQEGSFTKAAQALSLSQPAVSHQIRQLEEEFGMQIFHKDSKELRPTPAGAVLIKYARRALAVYNNARQAIEDSRSNLRRFTVAITPTVAESLVPQTLAYYCMENSDAHINIMTDTIKNIYDKLKSFETDLAIVEGKPDDSSLTSVLLDTDFLCLAVSPQHPFSKRASVPLMELKKEKFIMRSRPGNTRVLFERYLENNGETLRSFNVMMEIDNVATIKELVSRNLGVTVIARSACLEELRTGRLAVVPIENSSMIREINLVFHRDFSHPEVLDEIRRIYSSF